MALKAYSFSESEHLNAGVVDRTIFEHEKLLASEFVDKHPCKPNADLCPLCKSSEIDAFAIIAKTPYFRCRSCWSLFIPVSEDIVEKYRNYAPLKHFRESQKFQNSARGKRKAVWREQLFWIEFRSARFSKPLKSLNVVEIGGRFEGFSEMAAPLCLSYENYRNIKAVQEPSDAIIYFGQLILEIDPGKALKSLHKCLNKDGLLFLGSRVSTGFDILTLKGDIDSIYPYECSTIPSIEALNNILVESGFEVLEISTPGTLDIQFVAENSSKLNREDLFARYLIEKADDSLKSEFQRFLQKNAMSSHAQLVARVRHG